MLDRYANYEYSRHTARHAVGTSEVVIEPYPPGTPVLMSGDEAGAANHPITEYLLALEDLDRRFPNCDHDIHGVERDPVGAFLVECRAVGEK